MQQRRWLEMIKDYNLTLLYHPNKANVVVDALSRKSTVSLVCLITQQKRLLEDMEELGTEVHI